ncbi:Uncharacterised protein [Bordetella pertussis]|nr:Uncharacterised protein [Bordetella pertussis]CPM73272.1 Uncharacterised protein [Bordetella pertussis]
MHSAVLPATTPDSATDFLGLNAAFSAGWAAGFFCWTVGFFCEVLMSLLLLPMG